MKRYESKFVCLIVKAAIAAALSASAVNAASVVERLDGTPVASMPVPSKSDMLTGQRPYLVGPFDRLVIDVFNVPGLTLREVQVDASGRVSFPLVGIVEVLGLTPAEIELLMRQRLKANYVRDPQVSVNLKESLSQLVTVFGEVKRPGQYPVLGKMTLLSALAKAEGTGEFAQLKKVMIFRTVQGTRYAGLYDLKAIKKGLYEDPEVFPNDLIVVDKSMARQIFRDVLLLSPLFGPTILALSR